MAYPLVARPKHLFMRLYSICCSVNFGITAILFAVFPFLRAKLINLHLMPFYAGLLFLSFAVLNSVF